MDIDKIFPKYINLIDHNDIYCYMLWKVDSHPDIDTYHAEYRSTSSLWAYGRAAYIEYEDGKYKRHISGHDVELARLMPTTVWRFLRLNASFIDMPLNREVIDKAIEDAKNSCLFNILNIKLVDYDDKFQGFTSKKIEPFATFNGKLIDFKHLIMKYV